MGLDVFVNYFYHKNMGRPKKKKTLLMNVPLRIMLTAEQKGLIEEAAKLDQADMTAWVRPILLQAAKARIQRRDMQKEKS